MAVLGMVVLIAAVAGVVTFITLYTRRAPWWRSEVGVWLVSWPAALGLILINLLVVRMVGDYTGRQVVNLALFSVIAGSVWWSVGLLLRANRRDRR